MQQHDRHRDTGRTYGGLGYVEDFTGPFLITFGMLLFVAFFAIASAFGWLVVFLTFWTSDNYLKRLLSRRGSSSDVSQPQRHRR